MKIKPKVWFFTAIAVSLCICICYLNFKTYSLPPLGNSPVSVHVYEGGSVPYSGTLQPANPVYSQLRRILEKSSYTWRWIPEIAPIIPRILIQTKSLTADIRPDAIVATYSDGIKWHGLRCPINAAEYESLRSELISTLKSQPREEWQSLLKPFRSN